MRDRHAKEGRLSRRTAQARGLTREIASVYRDAPPWDASRERGLSRLATSFLRGGGFDPSGEPLAGGDRGVLDPVEGVGWLGVGRDLRAIAEEHLSPRQLDAAKLAADGHGSSAIGVRMGIARQAAHTHLNRAGEKLRACITKGAIYDGEDNAASHGGVGRIEPTETPILCGPRSPESDAMRVRHVPFFPAQDRPDVGMSDAGPAGYWTTMPRNPRDLAFEPRTIEADDVAYMPPVPDFYPDPGLDAVDDRRVLLTNVGDRPVVTVQGERETTGAHTRRHQRRVNGWIDLEGMPRATWVCTSTSSAVCATRSRLLPNVM